MSLFESNRCTHVGIATELSRRVPVVCGTHTLLCVIPGWFHQRRAAQSSCCLGSTHSGTDAADVSSRHPAAGAAASVMLSEKTTARVSSVLGADEFNVSDRKQARRWTDLSSVFIYGALCRSSFFSSGRSRSPDVQRQRKFLEGSSAHTRPPLLKLSK